MQKMDELLNKIPYEQIRDVAFASLEKDGMLEGSRHDIEYMVMEMVDVFKKKHMKAVKAVFWEIFFRQIRKNLAGDIKGWYDRKLSDRQNNVVHDELVAAMTDELDGCELGECGG